MTRQQPERKATCKECGAALHEAHTGECAETGGVEGHQTQLGGWDPELNRQVPPTEESA